MRRARDEVARPGGRGVELRQSWVGARSTSCVATLEAVEFRHLDNIDRSQTSSGQKVWWFARSTCAQLHGPAWRCKSAMEQKRQVDEVYCQVHGEASGPLTDETSCRLPHAIARCPVCSLAWIGPGPDDSIVLCILTRHIVETHPHTAHATTLRFNAVRISESPEPDDWCHHDPAQHRAVVVMESPS